MPLTSGQLATLKVNIIANTSTIPAGMPNAGSFVGTQVKDIPNNGDGNIAVATWYNLAAAPAYKGWNTSVQLKNIRAAVNLANYTPTDTPPASTNNVQGTNDALLFQNRAMKAQLQQANALFLVVGDGAVDCSPLQYRQSFNDCMTSIPTGAAGANQNAGWGTSAAPGAVRLAMMRDVTNAEKLYVVASTAAPNAGNVGADPRGGQTNPDTLGYVGSITASDVSSALNLP
ncbi:MAG TPA: hypothetical protein VNC50_16750 [Planctomycetia bacterium]|nr:hypothetical protein [Planctomycetia bacterium]